MTNIELETMAAVKNYCHTQSKVDWEQVRVQAAIAAMQGLLSSPVTEGYASFSRSTEENVAALSVKQADALINELKKKGE